MQENLLFKKMYRSKVILISHLPLPYHKIGSWTTLYDNYIKNENNKIDIIICPRPEHSVYNNVEYLFYKKSLLYKLKSKILKNRFYHILDIILKLTKKNPTQKYIIQVIDNYGFLSKLCDLISEKKLKDRIHIQYFFHGFKLYHKSQNLGKVFEVLDELILLTNLSLKINKKIYSNLPKNTSVLHNGIDTSLFNKKHRKVKESNKTTFLWCSQDRPKKGLHLILKIWGKFYKKFPQSELWIVGTYDKIYGDGIVSLNRIENHNLPGIYRKADVYLFPTQWTEPFGLTLIEALHCGCFCIASNLGGVPEVLDFGKFGWLVDDPDNPDNWFAAMENYMQIKPKPHSIPNNLYSLESWKFNMNKIVESAKEKIATRVK